MQIPLTGHRVRSRDAGHVTVEYCVGMVASVCFALVLLDVLTSNTWLEFLTRLFADVDRSDLLVELPWPGP